MVIETYDKLISHRKSNLTITEVGKDYGLSVHEMTRLLLKTGLIRSNNLLLDKYHLSDISYGFYYGFDILSGKYVDDTTGKLARYTIKFNNKGMLEIYNRLSNLGILPICEALYFTESDVVPTTKYSLYKRITNNRFTIYIGYTKNRFSDDKVGLKFQPISDSSANKIKKLMSNSTLSLEDSSRLGKSVGPRIDDRDQNYYKIDEWMYNRFIKSLDIKFETDKIIKNNKKLCKEII